MAVAHIFLFFFSYLFFLFCIDNTELANTAHNSIFRYSV